MATHSPRTSRTSRSSTKVDKDAPLKEDIRLLGRILGEVLRHQEGEAVFHVVETIRQTAVRFRRESDPAAGANLDKLLKKHNISEVTFFSLDVEGYEMDVLNGINFNDVFFHVIVIENHWNKDDFSFLEKFNFIKKYALPIHNHEIYINTQSPYFKTFII
jgi:phosphoenolpyruvate carboxylase